MNADNTDRPRVVIVGGGFGGMTAARALEHAPVDVTLVDRNNHQVFQPLLYQVATAELDASDIGYPLRRVFRRQENAEVVMDEVQRIDPASRTLDLASGDTLEYDYLVLATGVQTSYFGHPQWEQTAPGLKSIADALTMRRRVLGAFERAEQERDPDRRRAEMTFVVVGGGPTGVELAGALAELSRRALTDEFRHIDPSSAKVLLVEAGPTLLPSFPARLRKQALKQLAALGVEVRTSAMVKGVDGEGVDIAGERVASRVVLWTAGVQATPLARSLGVELDHHGRVPVTPTLNPKGLPNVFVVGDLAALTQRGQPVPGVAPAAIQEGRFAARAIVADLKGKRTRPFRYWNKGSLAVIGRSRAVANLPGGLKVSGFPAWVLYSTVHLFYLLGVSDRIRVFGSWAWSFFTSARGARLITRPPPVPRRLTVTP